MTGPATAVACLAGITFYVAFHHLLIYFRMKERRPSLPFAVLCFCVGIYDVYCIGLYNATDPAEGAMWQKAQFFALALVGIFTLRFISVFIERKSFKIDAAFMIFWAVSILTILAGPDSWYVTTTPAVKHVNIPGLDEVVYREVKLGPCATLAGLAGVGAAVYILYSLIAYYRQGNEEKVLPVLIGAGFLSLGVLNDVAVGQGLYPFFYMIEYSYLFLILGMAYSLVSAHLEAQADLHFERAQLLTIFDAIPAIVDVVDPKTYEILYANRYTRDLFGADVTGKQCYEVFHPFDKPCGFCNNEELLQDRTQVPRWEYHSEVVNRDFLTTNTIIRWPDGRDVKFELSIDITERKKAEEDLKRLAAAVDEAAESIIVTDPKGKIVYVNPAFEKMTGYDAPEIVGKKPAVLQSGKHDEEFYADLWSTISEGQSWRGRFTNRKKDGALFEEEAVISPVRDETGKTVNYVAVKRDVTHEIALQNQLRHSQKMDALGELAGGVAHDFTNMLVVILGRAQIAKSKVAPSSGIHTDLDEIIDAGNKLSILTGELLAFAHKAPISLKNVNLNKAIMGVEALLNRSVGKSVNLTIRTTEGPLLANIDAAQIEQAVVHFAINARDAMSGGGRILIETSWLELSEAEAIQLRSQTGSDLIEAGRYATIGVSDTGAGMSKEVAARIFDPFFSTKKDKQSSGLGMSTAYGIVAQHDGCITVYSHPGRGTTITIYLPLLAAPDDADTAPLPTGKGETILLVDDDAVARKALVRILQGLRYTVLEAETGAQCLELARAHKKDIDLLISDYVMPGIKGQAFVDEMRKTLPDLKVLLASGYPRTILAGLPDDQRMIQKPFTLREVALAVRDLLS